MAERQSPLGAFFVPGDHGNAAAGVGVTLRERKNLSIVQVTAWIDTIPAVLTAIGSATGLVLQNKPGLGRVAGEKSVFGFAPGRYFVVGATPDLELRLRSAISSDLGTMIDLTHGRTVIRIGGPGSEWVLSKLFAIDFSEHAFPIAYGRATLHHDIHANIQRIDDETFDIYVFRTFARSFWQTLGHAAAEVGYRVE
ncbi:MULTISPECIES: sarcosine oxidase subunit gamma [Phyllobacterium]|jgi:heterotetrameric sarcosine oxidase gamma subunit|uniref:Sarcosine oxidase subunit gamma n=1 Tax=Phyllobacterium sophorae TaxID=1520277 RepID=A0A2P7BHI7_9HYPH|nr:MULTISPECIES: sarcosine oxidase subunit gamma family protein [Phyllobacterium]PSH65950.1 sarcosine oxidase subunit gamma [Phyllobacterium sophorae]UXN64539.1 sarcosine oxidase subunit gamma [Phyllobacterium sp. A18/5-2]